MTAKLLGWRVDQITFYPYGGSSSFHEDINRPLKEEFLILLMGPFLQTVFYFLCMLLPLPLKTFSIIRIYHYSLLIFNLLPIYPLDGGKLLNLLFSYRFSYRKSLLFSLWFSFIVLGLLFCLLFPQSFSLQLVLMFFLLLSKIIGEFRKKDYYYQKFLLERYLKNYPYQKRKMVHSITEMMRDHRHIIQEKNHFYTEKQVLEKKFKKDRFGA